MRYANERLKTDQREIWTSYDVVHDQFVDGREVRLEHAVELRLNDELSNACARVQPVVQTFAHERTGDDLVNDPNELSSHSRRLVGVSCLDDHTEVRADGNVRVHGTSTRSTGVVFPQVLKMRGCAAAKSRTRVTVYWV